MIRYGRKEHSATTGWGSAWLVVVLCVASGSCKGQSGDDGTVRIAVAANFHRAADSLVDRFGRGESRVVVSVGSTGKLFAQIENEAPYDVFLSADARRPALLEQRGLAVPGSRFTYALGRLAVYGPLLRSGNDGIEVIRRGEFAHLAIANPVTAPYGLAAKQVLQRLGLWSSVENRVVRGENVAQAFQFVEVGAAEVGFVARSYVIDQPRHRYAEVPAGLHDAIRQDAVLLVSGKTNETARQFLRFLKSREARTLIERAGYAVPRDG